MKLLSQKLLEINNSEVKYLIIDQTIYYEQMYTRLLNFVDNYCSQYYNGIILVQLFLYFHYFNF